MTHSLKKSLFHHAQCLYFVLFNKINLFLYFIAIHLFYHDEAIGIYIRALIDHDEAFGICTRVM